MVTTFNEWGEGSAVESADGMVEGGAGGWASTSGYGRYIDLLHDNIPAPAPPTTTSTSSTTVVSSATSPGSSAAVSSPGTTVTTTMGQSSITVAAAGDISCEPGPTLDPAARCAEPLTADAVVAMNPLGVLALGDLQYVDGALSFPRANTIPPGAAKNKTYPAPGNHEWLTSNAQGYRDYFSSEVASPPEVDVQRLYYGFDLGSWHFISLDSDCKGAGGCSPTGAQSTWLKADLAANDGKPTIAYWHHPRFTSDVRGDNTSMTGTWNLLVADRDVQLALAGHTHHYERFAPMGTEWPGPGWVARVRGRLRRSQPRLPAGRQAYGLAGHRLHHIRRAQTHPEQRWVLPMAVRCGRRDRRLHRWWRPTTPMTHPTILVHGPPAVHAASCQFFRRSAPPCGARKM